MATDTRTSSKKFTKEEKSWILYDWANSVYATNIMAVLFPIYFGNVCAAAGADNLVLWSYGTSVATFLVAVCAPVLGSLADHKGHKKRLFVACLILGVAFRWTLQSLVPRARITKSSGLWLWRAMGSAWIPQRPGSSGSSQTVVRPPIPSSIT